MTHSMLSHYSYPTPHGPRKQKGAPRPPPPAGPQVVGGGGGGGGKL